VSEAPASPGEGARAARQRRRRRRRLALAKKKDTTMSQMTSLVKAEKVAAKVRVLVAMAVVADRKAQAPTGIGSRTSPAIVDTKMDSSVQPWRVMPAGTGTRKRSARPREMESTRGTGLAPGQAGGAGAAGAAAAAAAEATTRAAERAGRGSGAVVRWRCRSGMAAGLQGERAAGIGGGCCSGRQSAGGAQTIGPPRQRLRWRGRECSPQGDVRDARGH
jgi:hypothetical protein